MDTEKVNYFIAVDQDKCLACKNCEIACVLAHNNTNLQGVSTIKKSLKPRITVVTSEGRVVPSICRQCEEAPCAQACRIDAITQEDGFVKLNEEKCVGCKLCVKACPFGAINIQEISNLEFSRIKRKAVKCDLCSSSKQLGMKRDCACVGACPTKALRLTDTKEDRAKYPGALDRKPA